MIFIILSTYNGSMYLFELLTSLEMQTVQKWKLIARDDGSNDESYKLLKQFAAKSSIHIELLNHRVNLGVKKSFELLMNKAVEMGAEYIMFCDQDDIWGKNKIEKTILKMKEMENQYPNLPILVHTDLTVVDKNTNLINSSFWKYQNINPSKNALNNFITYNNITGCSMMINHALVKRINIIPKSAIMHDWWIAMVASAFGRIGYIDEPLILYRQHSTNDTGAKQYGWKYWLNRLIKKPSLDKYIMQARVFLEHYRDKLSPEHVEMLEAVSRLNQMNWFGRRRTLIKYKIFKNGLIRNIGLIVFA